MRKAKLMLTFNKPVHQLQVKVAEIDGVVTPIGDKTKWSSVLSGIKPGTYPIHVCANNMIVMMPDITIRSAIGGEGDLP